MHRFAFLALLSAFLALPASAGDCDDCLRRLQPKDCAERIARAKANGCVIPCDPVPCTPTPAQPCTAVPCSPVPCQSVPCTPVVVKEPFQVNVPMAPTGFWLLGGGPNHSEKWGATLLGGYHFKSGVQFLIGPTWTPHDAVDGIAVGRECKIPFHVERQGPWGAQALILFRLE